MAEASQDAEPSAAPATVAPADGSPGRQALDFYEHVLKFYQEYLKNDIYHIHKAILRPDRPPSAETYHAQMLRLVAVFAEINLYGDVNVKLAQYSKDLPKEAVELALNNAAEFFYRHHVALLHAPKNTDIPQALLGKLPARPLDRIKAHEEKAKAIVSELVKLGYNEWKDPQAQKKKSGLKRFFGG